MQSDENYAQRRLLQYHQQQQQQQQQQQSSYKNAQQTFASEPQISQSTCSSTSSSTISDSGSSVHTSTCSPPSDNYKFDIIANEEIARQTNKTDYDVKKEKYGHTNSHGHMDGHVASKGCGVAQNEHFYYVPTRYATNTMLPSSSSSASCTEHYNSNHTVTCHTVPSDSNSNKNNSCSKSSSLLHCESVYDKPMHCESSSSNRTGGNKTITSITANQQDIKKDTIYTQHNFNDYNNYQEKSKTNSTIYFSQPEYFSISNIPYMAPPSPAPCDRFIPPPPLASSSINDDKFHSTNSSLECYSNNAFPSPSPKSEHFPALARFILPPASATPTIDRQDFTCSPKKIPFRNNCPSDAINSYEMNRYATSSTKSTSSNDFCPPTFFNKFTPINSSYRDKYRSLSQCQEENFQERLPLSNIQTQTLPSKNGRYHHHNHNHHDNNAIMTTTSHRNYNNFPNTTNNYTTDSSNHFLIAATDAPRQNADKISNVEKYSHSNIQQSLQSYTNSPNDPNFTLGGHYKNSNPYKSSSDRFATLPNLNNERLHNKMAKINMYSTNCNDKKFTNAIESDQIQLQSQSQSQSNEQQQQQHYQQQVPSSAHIPVERYVPQTNGTMSKDMYKYTSSAVHYQDRYMTINTCTIGISPSERYIANAGDPYMRRDLGYHHHYRPQTPSHLYYQQYQPTTAHCHRIRYANNQRTPRCCVTPLNTNTQMDSYSSPGSSSSNSIASATCSDSYTCNILSPSLIRTPKNQCVKHGGCMANGGGGSGGGISGGGGGVVNSMNSSTTTVEYIGASGGRLISSSTIGTPISTLPHSPIDACILANHCGSNCELQCNHIVEEQQTVVFEQTKPISSTLPIINSNNSCSNNNDGAGTIPNVCCAVVTGGTRKLVQSKTNKTTATKCNNNLTTTSTIIHNNGINNSNNSSNTW